MKKLFIDILMTWNRDSNERSKLQKTYFSLALLVVVIAGLVSLINLSIGGNLVLLASFLAAVYITNTVVWALTDAFVIRELNALAKKPSSKK